ncbi:hypothetical protein Tco_0546046 [Tanacetum coccineum]
MDKSESYLAAPEHKECYDGLIKSFDLDKSLFSTYDKVYSLKRSQKDKDNDEDPFVGSDRGLKKRKTSKDVELTKSPKAKEFSMPQDQEGNLGNDYDEPMKETVSKRDWFTKPTQPQEPTDPDWNTFDELMSTPIDFSAYIINGLKITNLTQETLLGPAFRLLKGTHTNYAELEYDFEECYKDLSEKLDWENPEGGDYFFNNDLKYLQGGVLTMTYTTSITKTKVAQYDLLGIEDMVPNIWVPVKVAYDKHALCGISHWREQRKTFYGYARGLQLLFDYQYVVSIQKIRRIVLHSPKDHSGNKLNMRLQRRPISRIGYIVCDDSWEDINVVPTLKKTPITPYPILGYPEDSELKDKDLRNKAILEGLISDDESGNDCWKKWKSHEIYYHNYDEGDCENEMHEEGHELCSIKTREVPVCQIKRYKMIRYSFKDEEEYVAVKENEYDDLTITSEEAC